MIEALGRLDARLAAACDRMRADVPGAARDSFRGLYIDAAEVERLLVGAPGAPRLWTALSDGPEAPLSRLRQAFELDEFEQDALLLALAPEIDLRYERLYAYLQDDVTRRRPTVDLALNLLCGTVEEKIACRSYFTPDAPLLRQALLRLAPDPTHVEPALLAHFLRVDEQIVSCLLGQRSLDPRLADRCEYLHPETTLAFPRLRALARTGKEPCLYFHGPDTEAKRAAAAAMAAEIGAPLLIAELAGATDAVVKLAAREARLAGAVLYAVGAATLPRTCFTLPIP
jgi:hypothetical protein